MFSFPIALQIAGRRAVVVGGGNVALRKVSSLLDAGASVRVIAPLIGDGIRALASNTSLECIQRRFAAGDVRDAFLVIAATDDESTNAAVVDAAKDAGVLCCDATMPQRGDFSVPAVHRMGLLTFTVDTSGKAPAFSKRLRDELSAQFGNEYAAAAGAVAAARDYVNGRISAQHRAPVLRKIAGLPLAELAAMSRSKVEHKVRALVAPELHERAPLKLTCASRSSALAMIQARTIVAELERNGIASSILGISTTGDKVQDRSIAAIGAESLFVKELELALRDRRADYAVHSCKDLPSSLPADMELCAITRREDPRDTFCSERHPTFASLPTGARVGTSSLRRRAQLCAKRSDLRYDDIRGNVDTRLKKLQSGAYDAIVLAVAGLTRLEARSTFMVPFEVEEMVPAVGQGALAIEARSEDGALRERMREALNDPLAELAVLAERAALRELQGGCQAPIGIHGSYDMNARTLVLRGVIASPNGQECVRATRRATVSSAHDAQRLGIMLARHLYDSGGAAILESLLRPATQPLSGKLILLPRTQERSSRIAEGLRSDGAEVLEVDSGAAASAALGERTPNMIVFPSSGAVSAVGPYLEQLLASGMRPQVAAMGPRSAGAAAGAGFAPDVIAMPATVEALLAAVRNHLTTHFSEPAAS